MRALETSGEVRDRAVDHGRAHRVP
jgi:hypothetical protein